MHGIWFLTRAMGDGMGIKQTPLHAFHRAHNARMVPFAGCDMPVQYANDIKLICACPPLDSCEDAAE